MNILNNITIQDVRLFFSSKCCTKLEESSKTDDSETLSSLGFPCQNSPQILGYFMAKPLEELRAATITIGTKYYGRMDATNKKKAILRHILSLRQNYPEVNYYFTFELSESGQLHAHGVVHNMYLAAFGGIMGSLGRHNKTEKSFAPIKNLKNYWLYINKDLGKEKINTMKHNIGKNKIQRTVAINKPFMLEELQSIEISKTGSEE